MADGAAKGLSIRGLAKTYTTRSGDLVEAVTPVDFDVAPGEFVSLVGPSGCGKSTLLNILAGFVEPSTGQAFVGDEPIRAPNIDRGMVFQDYALFPWLSVLENVEFGLERKGIRLRSGATSRSTISVPSASPISPTSAPTSSPAA